MSTLISRSSFRSPRSQLQRQVAADPIYDCINCPTTDQEFTSYSQSEGMDQIRSQLFMEFVNDLEWPL